MIPHPANSGFDPAHALACARLAALAYPDRGESEANYRERVDHCFARIAHPAVRVRHFASAATDTQGFVAATDDCVVIAFRGSREPRDFVTDLRFHRKRTGGKFSGKNIPGQKDEDPNLPAPQSSCPPAAPLRDPFQPKLINSEKAASLLTVPEFGLSSSVGDAPLSGKKISGQKDEDPNLPAPQSSCPSAAPLALEPHRQWPIANSQAHSVNRQAVSVNCQSPIGNSQLPLQSHPSTNRECAFPGEPATAASLAVAGHTSASAGCAAPANHGPGNLSGKKMGGQKDEDPNLLSNLPAPQSSCPPAAPQFGVPASAGTSALSLGAPNSSSAYAGLETGAPAPDPRPQTPDPACRQDAGSTLAVSTVHSGFLDAWDSVRAQVLDALSTLDSGPSTPLFVTGHSLGGALALLCARGLSSILHPPSAISCYTFGQPRVGDAAFAAGFDAALRERTFRVVHEEDVVPRLPLWVMGFRHCGHEVFLPSWPDRGWSPIRSASESKNALRVDDNSRSGAISPPASRIQLDPSLWTKCVSDALGLWQAWTRREAHLLRDHFMARYVARLEELNGTTDHTEHTDRKPKLINSEKGAPARFFGKNIPGQKDEAPNLPAPQSSCPSAAPQFGVPASAGTSALSLGAPNSSSACAGQVPPAFVLLFVGIGAGGANVSERGLSQTAARPDSSDPLRVGTTRGPLWLRLGRAKPLHLGCSTAVSGIKTNGVHRGKDLPPAHNYALSNALPHLPCAGLSYCWSGCAVQGWRRRSPCST